MKKEDLIILRRKLPRGFADILHLRLLSLEKDFSKSYIYQVLLGTRFNEEILDEAVKLAQETTSKEDNRSNIIKNL